MRRSVRIALMVLAWLAILPWVANAQASITGVVRDTSGAVLPGVTVEATSPALIEKVRTVVTDGTGQYRIETLRPGTYTVTFTLPGFATVRREGIELTGSFVATVSAELRLGTLEETITVSGESPIVDVQNTTRQAVLTREDVSIIPSGRNVASLAGLLASVNIGNQDLGGLAGESASAAGAVTVHGNAEVRSQVNGVAVTAQGNGTSGLGNVGAYQEITVDISGIGAEQKEGGVRINVIPAEGGNTFAGSFYAGFANSSMQGTNLTHELHDRGLHTPPSLRKYYDLNPVYGGPIKRDQLWFHATARYNVGENYAPMFFNKNAGNPNVWTYEPDTNRSAASNDGTFKGFNGRITWQATQKHKFAVAYDYVDSCQCPRSLTAELAPESNVRNHAFLSPKDMWFVDWTAPLTNRLLFESHSYRQHEHAFRPTSNIYFTNDPGGVRLNGVVEQSSALTYRAAVGDSNNTQNYASIIGMTTSYITGAHAFKVGVNLGFLKQELRLYYIDSPMDFRFNNGVPNQLTLRGTDYVKTARTVDHGMYVQDRWTVKRLTVTGGLRYDYYKASFPETTIGPTQFAPTRNLVLPAADGMRWNDVEPRSGLAYDLFGNGKTALKATLNKYMAYFGVPAATFDMAPVARLVTTTTRSWNDTNRNFVPDCNLLTPTANDECGAMASPDFGSTRPGANYDPDTITGWNKRDYNWQFSAGVQHELLPRVSLDVGYYRTWFGNFVVTDDLARTAADFDRFSITAPRDPRLPGGGGYEVSGLYNVKPEKFSLPANNLVTFADNYGTQIRHWDGVDVTVNARLRPGLSLQGGVSTGRTLTDNCEVLAALPEINPVGSPECRVSEPLLTTVKVLGTYTVPRIDVQLTSTVQSVPGPRILANYVATNAIVQPSLGRPLAGSAANVTVNVVEPGLMYGERSNQVQLRISKSLRAGPTRATASLDLYNLLNANPVLTMSNAFASWQTPHSILNPRWAKVVLQFEF